MEVWEVRKGNEFFTKKLVNIIALEGRNFNYQAYRIKKLDQTFNFDAFVIDGNGLGVGLIDMLMMPTTEDGVFFPAYNVKNLDDYPLYKDDQKPGAAPKIHIIKTNQHTAGTIHTTCYNELMGGHVKFLIDEKQAKNKLNDMVKTKKMTIKQKIEYMEPYKWTSVLVNETTNLKINREGTYLKLELIRPDEEKDTFSAMEYGLFYITNQEKDHYSRLSKKKKRLSALLMKG